MDMVPADKLPVTIFLVTMCDIRRSDEYALLYHCEIDNQRRTFMKGEWYNFALGEYKG